MGDYLRKDMQNRLVGAGVQDIPGIRESASRHAHGNVGVIGHVGTEIGEKWHECARPGPSQGVFLADKIDLVQPGWPEHPE